jgi:C-terminal processing protease CtpA/Prc
MKIQFTICAGVLLATTFEMAVSAANPPPDFGQVRELIQANLPGVTEAELDRAALDGLLQNFRGKVRLLEATPAPAHPNISQSSSFDGGIGYLRIDNVAAGLATDVTRLCGLINATNKLKGVIFDLRFSDGDDYAAAANTAELFVADERELLDWGPGVVKSSPKTNAFSWPVVVLVNNETAGASEALAALMRETDTGLILGNTTRGAAMMTKEFPLANGQRLRIAAIPVKLGKDSPLPATGVTPDIQVVVTPADERVYRRDPYAELSKPTTSTSLTAAGTNRAPRRIRTTEADLVRARREGLSPDSEFLSQRAAEPEVPVIRDPALARAVDLLKGLAVVRRSR